jgi:hypothetical protein
MRRREVITAAAWPRGAGATGDETATHRLARNWLSCTIPSFPRCIPRWTEDAELH